MPKFKFDPNRANGLDYLEGLWHTHPQVEIAGLQDDIAGVKSATGQFILDEIVINSGGSSVLLSRIPKGIVSVFHNGLRQISGFFLIAERVVTIPPEVSIGDTLSFEYVA